MNVLLVDGTNALHRLRMNGGDAAAVRARLIGHVRAAAPRGATVYFDGHPGSGAFGGTEDRGVTIRFSGDREADEDIVDRVRESRRPRSLVVVTDDLELARRTEQMGASSLRVAQFLADVLDPAPDGGPPARGFTAADFGLPEEIDLDRPPDGLFDRAPDGRARRPRRRGGATPGR